MQGDPQDGKNVEETAPDSSLPALSMIPSPVVTEAAESVPPTPPPGPPASDSEPLTPFPPSAPAPPPALRVPSPLPAEEHCAVQLPCYATALNTFAAFAPIRARQSALLHTLDEIIGFLKLRVQAEDAYARALQRVSTQPLSCVPSTLGDALEGLRSDVVNRAVQHSDFGRNLSRDVHGPLAELRTTMARKIKSIGNAAAALQKDVRSREDRYRKTLRAFEKAEKEAEDEVRQATQHGLGLVPETAAKEVSDILDGVVDSPPAPSGGAAAPAQKSKTITQSLKSGLGLLSGSRASQSPGDMVNWLLPSEGVKKEFLRASAHHKIAEAENLRRLCVVDWISFLEMRRTASVRLQILLTKAQWLEEDLFTAVQDALRKHAVFESSALANQQYDTQMIFQVMEGVDWQLDLMKGMNEINGVLHGDPQHDAETDLGPVAMSPAVQGATAHFPDTGATPSPASPPQPPKLAGLAASPPQRASKVLALPEPPTKPVLGLQLTDRHATTVPSPSQSRDQLARAALPQVVCSGEDPNDMVLEAAMVESGPHAGEEPPAKITAAAEVMRLLESIMSAQESPQLAEAFASTPPAGLGPLPSPAEEDFAIPLPPHPAFSPDLAGAARRLSIDDDDLEEDDTLSDTRSPRAPQELTTPPLKTRMRFRPRLPKGPRMGWGLRAASSAMEEEGVADTAEAAPSEAPDEAMEASTADDATPSLEQEAAEPGEEKGGGMVGAEPLPVEQSISDPEKLAREGSGRPAEYREGDPDEAAVPLAVTAPPEVQEGARGSGDEEEEGPGGDGKGAQAEAPARASLRALHAAAEANGSLGTSEEPATTQEVSPPTDELGRADGDADDAADTAADAAAAGASMPSAEGEKPLSAPLKAPVANGHVLDAHGTDAAGDSEAEKDREGDEAGGEPPRM